MNKRRKIFLTVSAVVVGALIITLVILKVTHYEPSSGPSVASGPAYQLPPNFSVYKSNHLDIQSMAYPTGWNIKEGSGDDYTVSFESTSTKSNVGVILIAMDEGDTLDYSNYTERLSAMAKTEPAIKSFEKSNESIKTINGREWLIYDTKVTIASTGATYYNRTGLVKTGKGAGRQYFQILLESDKAHFLEDSLTFDTMVDSFRI